MENLVIKNNRINWIDTAKAIAIFLVVLGHALDSGLLQKNLYAFHVPVFFLLSGFCCNVSDGFGQFLKKRFKQIMIPYYVFGLIAIAVYLLMGRFVTSDLLTPVQCLYGLLYATVKTNCLKFNLHIWFLPALFVMQLIYYPVNKLIKHLNSALPRLHYVFWVGGIVISFVVAYAVKRITWGFIFPFGIDTALILFPFFIIGGMLNTFKQLKQPVSRKFKSILINLICAVFSFALFIVLERWSLKVFPDGVNYPRDSIGDMRLFYVTAAAGIMTVIFVSRVLPDIKFILYIGKKTLPILVMHKFPLMFFTAVPLFVRFSQGHNIVFSVAISIVAIILCLAADAVILKLFPFLYGKKKENKTEQIQKS